MGEERINSLNPFRNGMTPFEFIGLVSPVLEGSDLKSDVREILEREVDRAKRQSPFATLECVFDENNRMFLNWNTNFIAPID